MEELTSLTDTEKPNGSAGEVIVVMDQHDTHQKTKPAARLCFHPPSCSDRNLAIMSIVCGVSCLGVRALLLAVQAEQSGDRSVSRRSRRWSVMSLTLFVGGLVCLPFLVILVSYIMTLLE